MHRTRWLALGVGLGAIGSVLMALAMQQIGAWANGLGQDLVTIAILSVALGMLAWHCIWVSTHAKQRVADARQIGVLAMPGGYALWPLAVAVALSVLREGAETVLFVAGLLKGSPESQGALISSITTGLAVGAFAGWLIYAGLGRVKPHHLFAVTNMFILMLAGSLASQLAKTANQADWISAFSERAWDTSALLPNDSAIGMVLHGVLGFDASPTQLQVFFYFGTTVLIGVAARQMKSLMSRRLTAVHPKL
jgi:high-affinity iron transporter